MTKKVTKDGYKDPRDKNIMLVCFRGCIDSF